MIDFEQLKIGADCWCSYESDSGFVRKWAELDEPEVAAINAALSEAARLQRACDEFEKMMLKAAAVWEVFGYGDARQQRFYAIESALSEFRALRASAAPGEGTP